MGRRKIKSSKIRKAEKYFSKLEREYRLKKKPKKTHHKKIQNLKDKMLLLSDDTSDKDFVSSKVKNSVAKRKNSVAKKTDLLHKFLRLEDKSSLDCISRTNSKLSYKKLKKIVNRYEVVSVEEETVLFYKVTISCADSDISQDFLVKTFKTYARENFVTYGYFKSHPTISFYLEGKAKTASIIENLDRKLQSPNGHLIAIDSVKIAKEFEFLLNCEQIECMRLVMIDRYDYKCGLLNLSAFHKEPKFVKNNIFVPLVNDEIFKQVIEIIKNTLCDIQAIDLSSNLLKNTFFKYFSALSETCKSLYALNIDDNQFTNVSELNYLKRLPLTELQLKPPTNMKLQRFEKKVTKYLPLLKVLNGIALSTSSTNISSHFDLDLEAGLNGVSLSENVQESLQKITQEHVRTYLDQYYSLFDGRETRTHLLQAYTPTATLTFRNHPTIPNNECQGNEIATFLQNWPDCEHDKSSFDFKISEHSNQEGLAEICACVGFSDGTKLCYRRNMTIVSFNSGFCCSQDSIEFIS